MKKIVCLVLALMLLSACSNLSQTVTTTQTDTPAPTETKEIVIPEEISIAVNVSDSFNPFLLTSQMNSFITPLVYDSLFELDNNYNALPLLANSSEISGNSCTISLKSGIMFSDGSAITANDVLYSFQLASASPAFGSQLSGITADIAGSNLVFTSNAPNALITSLLTFPIVKSGTGEMEIPVGSGDYYFADDKTLKSRTNSTTHTINLESVPSDSVSHAVRSSSLDLYYINYMSSEDYLISTQTKRVTDNRMVYLGVNGFRVTSELSKVIYDIIDRETILRNAYRSIGNISYTAVNPVVSYLPSIDFGSSQVKTEFSEESGLSYDNGLLLNGENIELDLIINDDSEQKTKTAEIIKTNLLAYNITLNIIPLSYEDYIYRINTNNFDLYLGEVKLKADMSLESFLYGGGSTSYGIVSSEKLIAAYNNYRTDITKADEFVLSFNEAPPFIPILFRDSAVATSMIIPQSAEFTSSNLLYNVENWDVKES